MAASLPPAAIVLAVGGAVVGVPEALCLLLAVEARTAAADVAICALLVSAFTALLLGTLLLARFFRDAATAADARAGAGTGAHAPVPASGTERFARVTLVVALVLLFLVTSCLLLSLTGTAGVRSCSA